jgi:predicted phosphoribosyltransferase
MTMTAAPLALPADSLALPALSPEAAARLERIRPHAAGLTPAALITLVEQAFRNFPAVNNEQIVRYLTTPTA